jgi:hypothetical protein
MWGVPLIPSAALAQGTALVGDFEIGALLLIRTGLQVLLSDSDQDDFTKNKVTLLAELRAALPVFRPAAFCDGRARVGDRSESTVEMARRAGT